MARCGGASPALPCRQRGCEGMPEATQRGAAAKLRKLRKVQVLLRNVQSLLCGIPREWAPAHRDEAPNSEQFQPRVPRRLFTRCGHLILQARSGVPGEPLIIGYLQLSGRTAPSRSRLRRRCRFCSAGANLGCGMPAKPPIFRRLGPPSAWNTPENSLLWTRVMSWRRGALPDPTWTTAKEEI